MASSILASAERLNQKDNASTDVFLPEGATTVMAVSWDGKRYIIYDTTGATVDAQPDASTGPGFITPAGK